MVGWRGPAHRLGLNEQHHVILWLSIGLSLKGLFFLGDSPWLSRLATSEFGGTGTENVFFCSWWRPGFLIPFTPPACRPVACCPYWIGGDRVKFFAM